MANFTLSITGFDALAGYFKKAPDAIRKVQRQVLYEHALNMFAESQVQVPFRTGNLQRSGVVEPPASSGDAVVYIGYGGSATQYAFKVHEMVGHDFATVYNDFDTRKKAKYLEDPVLEGIPALKADLFRRVKAVLDAP